MALDYGTILPAQTDTAAAYPQGKAKNVTVPGAGDGTPWYADLVNDLLFGPWQRFLKLTGTVPSGTADTADDSQHVDALQRWIWGTLISSNWAESFPDASDYNAICYSPSLGYWVAVGEAGKVLLANGYETTLVTIGAAPNLNAVVWSESEGLFIAGGDGGALYTSPTGAVWTVHASGTANDITGMAVKPGSPDMIVAVVGASAADIRYSSDGIVWAAAVCPVNTRLGVCWASDLGLFVTAAITGTTDTSPDGITWTAGTTVGAVSARAVTWSVYHQLLIAACGSGFILTSADGLTWESQGQIASNMELRAIAVDEDIGQIIAVGDTGIAASFDASTWYHRISRVAVNHKAVAYSETRGLMLVTGDNGRLMQSLRGLHT